MSYDFSILQKGGQRITEQLSRDISSIHTGRASVAILDGVSIESYGSRLAIPHVATIATEDARTLRIVPWDKSNSKEIEKAINTADLGISVSVDDAGLRVFFPPLTTERRMMFVKIVRDKVEDARVALKGEREKTKQDIVAQEREGLMSEDDKNAALEEMQKIVETLNTSFETAGKKKEQEILSE